MAKLYAIAFACNRQSTCRNDNRARRFVTTARIAAAQSGDFNDRQHHSLRKTLRLNNLRKTTRILRISARKWFGICCWRN